MHAHERTFVKQNLYSWLEFLHHNTLLKNNDKISLTKWHIAKGCVSIAVAQFTN